MNSFSLSRRRSPLLSAAVVLAVVTTLAGCSSTPATPSPDASPAGDDRHGYVAGAEEAGEAQLSLALIDEAGAVTVHDLLTDESVSIEGSGAESPATSVVGDGRFVYVVHGGAGTTRVQVVDTGVWTVDHEDHMHYYRADPSVVGGIEGRGTPTIASNDGYTALLFAGSGDLALLSHEALGEGAIDIEWMQLAPSDGGFAVPFGGHLIVSASADGDAQIRVLSMLGDPQGEHLAACPSPRGAVVTRVGLVASCADGAVLVTEADDALTAERVPYPAGGAAPAGVLDGRAGRQSLAGVAGAAGAWRFDARDRAWVFLPSDAPLVRVSAVADDLQLSVAIDDAGRVRVLDEAGVLIGQSEPLVAASLADEATRREVRLVVDAQRAYVFGPAEGSVFEIDYRDGARVARTFESASDDAIDAPAVFMELVG